MKWISIKEQKPQEEQEVFYYFGIWDKVYKGFYQSYRGEDYPEDCCSDVFYGKGGFLTDDVTFWMPCNEGDEIPEEPPFEIKMLDRHFAYDYYENQKLNGGINQ